MKIAQKKVFTHIVNVVTIALIVECFLCAMMLVNKFGRENCFTRMEENTQQIAKMFTHALNENQSHLTLFADILAANDSTTEELLQKNMEVFCSTQSFDAVCIHREDGEQISYGLHPHEMISIPSFQEDVKRLPYTSDVFRYGDTPQEQYVYQAVPVIHDGHVKAILYGFLNLEAFPNFITSAAYGGTSRTYMIDGDTGSFLMDEYHDHLSNLYQHELPTRDAKEGYDVATMRDNLKTGKSGYLVFQLQSNREWYYIYYTPVGINNWFMLISIDESTAFATYDDVIQMLIVLAICVIVLMVVHVLALMKDEKRTHQKNKENLRKSQYINNVQRALINAHNVPEFVDQALKIIAEETKSQTTLLMTLSGKTITSIQYWPSEDKAQAMDMVGRNIRDDFPTFYDLLIANQNVIYDSKNPTLSISDITKQVFDAMDVQNLMLVPITDNAGIMKGALAVVNSEMETKSCEMLECVTYDFFMALNNLENQAIIRRMGAMDYLTNLKNRNSFEAELSSYSELDCQTLWCVFIDVNGLHEVNNTRGHQEGDRMLCAVADMVKKVFGEDSTYRLGGDEFVAFASNGNHQDFMSRKYKITEGLARKGYFVSVGFASVEKNEHGIFDVEKVLAEAEAIMYRDKWDFYQEHEIPSQRGHFPHPLPKPYK